MRDSLLSSMLFIKPSERRDLTNNRFVQETLNFIPVAIRDMDDYRIIPDDNFPSRMKGIYQLERYLSLHYENKVIGVVTMH